MICYPFCSNKQFGVFYDEESDRWVSNDGIIPQGVDIAAVLDSVKLEFEKCFSIDYVNKRISLVFQCQSDPVSFPKKGVVFLSARGRDWDMYAYQFAHEFCHVMLTNGFYDAAQWFEETLCELASYFFLTRLSEAWKTTPPYPNWCDYAYRFRTYRDKNMQKAHKLSDGESFSSFINSNLEKLYDDRYDRPINALCAIKMLPIFEACPALWEDTTRICAISEKQSFKDLLYAWLAVAEYKDAVSQIITLFDY